MSIADVGASRAGPDGRAARDTILGVLRAVALLVTLAGDPITSKLTTAPGNNASIGGLKVVTASGWFAARPSGTENIYKVYAESFKDERHLQAIVAEAQEIVRHSLGGSANADV